MKPITYLIGDATHPIGDGQKIIPHVVNNIGAWGAGFVLAISKRWSLPEQEYLKLKEYPLGFVQLIKVEDDITVANIVGQHGIGFKNGIPPIRYDAIEKGFDFLYGHAKKNDASIHMPRLGCGLAGGHWDEIEKLITTNFSVKDIEVFVYDLK